MKRVICAVRDSALAAFMQPFFVPALGVASRSFADEVNRQESPMFQHPEDYVLYELGTFDEDSGRFDLLPDPRQVARASDLKRS